MNFDPISDDPVPDKKNPATLAPVTFESRGYSLLGILLLAQGAGPHPALVLLHGFPGYERNLDLAHVFRRAGWNVLIFHYRGAWGSEGSFSFSNCLEDVSSALTFLRTESTCSAYRIDPQKIVLIGHSLGGFAALMTAACDPHIHSAASVAGFNVGAFIHHVPDSDLTAATRFFEQSLPPLQGVSADQLMREAVSCAESWNLLNYVTVLSQRSLLLVGGSRDEIAPIPIHHQPLVCALRNERAENLCDIVVDADHVFSDKRVTLSRIVLSWLENQRRR